MSSVTRTKPKDTSDETIMPMLTIEIPNEGVWNAVTCETLGTQYVVLENFRVHPFQDGVVKMRTESVDPAVVHLQEGTPVIVDGKNGVVLMTDPHMPMIMFDDDVARIVPVDSMAYRMGTTIDKLHEISSHEMKIFRGVPYLVPTSEATPPSPSTLSSPDVVTDDQRVAECIRHWPTSVLDRAVNIVDLTERDAIQSFRSDRAQSGYTFVHTDNRLHHGNNIYYACIDPVPENMRRVARPCFKGKFHARPMDAVRDVVSFMTTLGQVVKETRGQDIVESHTEGRCPVIGDVITTLVDGVLRTHTIVKGPAPSVHFQKVHKDTLVVTVKCPGCDGHIEFDAHRLGDSRADIMYRSSRIKGHEGRNFHMEARRESTKRARTPVESYCEEKEDDHQHVRAKKTHSHSDPPISSFMTSHFAPQLEELRLGNTIEEDGQPAYKGVTKCQGEESRRYKVQVRRDGKILYLGTYFSTTIAAMAICAWRLDSTIASVDRMKGWFHRMKYDPDARARWVNAHIP